MAQEISQIRAQIALRTVKEQVELSCNELNRRRQRLPTVGLPPTIGLLPPIRLSDIS